MQKTRRIRYTTMTQKNQTFIKDYVPKQQEGFKKISESGGGCEKETSFIDRHPDIYAKAKKLSEQLTKGGQT